MPVLVNVPIRLRLDSATLANPSEQLARPVGAALGRALANSREAVLARRGGYVGLETHTPTFNWTGEGVGSIPAERRETIQAMITSWIDEAASDVGLHDFANINTNTCLLYTSDAADD